MGSFSSVLMVANCNVKMINGFLMALRCIRRIVTGGFYWALLMEGAPFAYTTSQCVWEI